MIYFLCKIDTGEIKIGTSNDIHRRKRQLEKDCGPLECLGWMRGGEEKERCLHAQFSDCRLGFEWFSPTSELLAYIHDNAFPGLPVADSASYKVSEHTAEKQDSLRAALMLQVGAIEKIFDNRRARGQKIHPYIHYDLHAGPGRDVDGNPGSPLVFYDVMAQYPHIKYSSALYEMDPDTAEVLRANVADIKNVEVRQADHNDLYKRMVDVEAVLKYHYGVIYVDPSDAQIPVDLLAQCNKSLPHVDIMINIAAATYKRQISRDDYVSLNRILPKIKLKWVIREPVGKHQWSILIGSNWRRYPDWQNRGFYGWTTPKGRAIYERLVYTSKQLRDLNQPTLPGIE